MSHLLRITYGPVQGFILAARKTRDLKSGSDLLVEIGKAICRAILREQGSKLIFPADANADCANIIQAVVEGDPRAICQRCRVAATQVLEDKLQKLTGPFDKPAAEEQVSRFLEFYGAWAEIENGDYRAAQATVSERMAARKALRDFAGTPFTEPKGQLPPASPLLPEYSAVVELDPNSKRLFASDSACKRFGLGRAEVLDGISLIKRCAHRTRFASTRMVAISDIYLLPEYAECRTQLEEAERRLEGTDQDLGDWLFGTKRGDDGEPILWQEDLLSLRNKVLETLGKNENPAFRLRPYYAVLHADGDDMGDFLSRLQTDTEHQKFSGKLDQDFSKKVRDVVEQHRGQLVFSGGDDVLAMCSLSQCVKLAVALRKLFGQAMACYPEPPTLSMGIAIVHVTEDLRHAVRLSEVMERYAKEIEDGKKDALAICVRTRGGTETKIRCKWESCGGLDAHFVAEVFESFSSKGVPRGFPFEVREEAARLGTVGSSLPPWAIRGSYTRLREKKDNPGGVPELPKWVDSVEKLKAFADLLIVAHFVTRGGQEE